jgi:hypothetical protein
MSTAKATTLLLTRLGSASTLLLSLHLALPKEPVHGVDLPDPMTWCDGQDELGRYALLVGGHALRQLPDGEEAIQAVLEAMARGEVPPGVQAVHAQPMAAEALAVAVAAEGVDEELVDGGRGSGKTQLEGMAKAALSELHHRAGFPLPLKALWLHSTLKIARSKTVDSLSQAHWGGLWSFRDDKQVAVLTIGGTEYVNSTFVGTQDTSAQDRPARRRT